MSMSIDWRLPWRRPGVLFLLGALFVPLRAEAQVPDVDTHEKANHLHALAMTAAGFVDQKDAMPIIARLHAESAALRDWQDPHAYECWRLQAALLHAIGQYDDALAYLSDAAEVALANGAPGLAAHTFLDAAGVLNDQGRMDEAQVLIKRAHDLITRDELTSTEQRRIQRRITVR